MQMATMCIACEDKEAVFRQVEELQSSTSHVLSDFLLDTMQARRWWEHLHMLQKFLLETEGEVETTAPCWVGPS